MAICVALIASSCKSFNTVTSGKKAPQGAPYELLVVCNAPEWESEVGEKLRSILGQPIPMLNQEEPMFSVLRVTADDFKNVLLEHRNILQVVIDKKAFAPSISAQYDVKSSPQMILTFRGASHEQMVEYLDRNAENLIAVLEIAERDRSIKYARKFNLPELEKIVNGKFDIRMNIPKGYSLRSESENFIWISYEFPAASQGFFIYQYPYTSKAQLKADNLIKQRNAFAKRIPGPSDGSFMTTVQSIADAEGEEYIPFEPSYSLQKTEGRVWAELRGLWEVSGDFMGGPFVSYTTVNEKTGMVITLDCYVYSPKYPKRNYLRELEHLKFMMNIPIAEN